HSLGVELVGIRHFAPHDRIDPWVGAGLGYRRRTGGSDGESDADLFDVARLTLGADLRVSHLFVIGPVASAGVYVSSEPILRPWFFVGLGGRLALSGSPGD